MLKTIVLAITVLVAGILGFAATRPDTFRVERSITVQAPPDKAFALVDDFHRWPAWSPWEHLDPAMRRSFSGPASGVGAVYGWEGNSDVGAGRMEIKRSEPASLVNIQLDFIAPFETRNTTVFRFVPRGDSTQVTWTMDGPMPYVSKLMSVFVSMDRLIGKDFETGLAQLKVAAER